MWQYSTWGIIMAEAQDKEIKLDIVSEGHSHEATETHGDMAAKTVQIPKTDEIKVRLDFFKKMQFWQFLSVIFLVLFIVSLFFIGGSGGITKTEARNKVQSYVDTVLAGRVVANVGEASAEGNLYLVPISIAGQNINSYITKDGRLFFPSGVEIDSILENPPPVLDAGDQAVDEVPLEGVDNTGPSADGLDKNSDE
ncbi:MAG: hypothetical protein AABX08_01450 [Nanoarchaeota archaeon]